VIARIKYSAGPARRERLTQVVNEAIETLLSKLYTTAGCGDERPARTVIAGNTVMQHLAAGLDVESIGTYPYTPQTLFDTTSTYRADGRWYVPCVAGYLGGDVVAGIFAVAQNERPCLLVDLGTNGEIALMLPGQHIICTSTAAGPVFEKRGEHELYGSQLIAAVAQALRSGAVDASGRLVGAVDTPLNQRDIRNLQLAKGAVCAGVLALLAEAGVAPQEIMTVCIAGSLGAALDMDDAACIGLLPPALLARAKTVGNAALAGASAALLAGDVRSTLRTIAGFCQYRDLSASSMFNDTFIDQLPYPYAP
jgi:uncharacterized 2Fe-2S/4Fe-4S cluster protein (DUF4445 family)